MIDFFADNKSISQVEYLIYKGAAITDNVKALFENHEVSSQTKLALTKIINPEQKDNIIDNKELFRLLVKYQSIKEHDPMFFIKICELWDVRLPVKQDLLIWQLDEELRILDDQGLICNAGDSCAHILGEKAIELPE